MVSENKLSLSRLFKFSSYFKTYIEQVSKLTIVQLIVYIIHQIIPYRITVQHLFSMRVFFDSKNMCL